MLNRFGAIAHHNYLCLKMPTPGRVLSILGDQAAARWVEYGHSVPLEPRQIHSVREGAEGAGLPSGGDSEKKGRPAKPLPEGEVQNPSEDVGVRVPIATTGKDEARRSICSQSLEDSPSMSKGVVKLKHFDITVAIVDTLNEPQKRRAWHPEVIPHESYQRRAQRRRKRKPRHFEMSKNPVSSHPSRHFAVLCYGDVYLPDGRLDKFHPANQGFPGDVKSATSGAVARQHLPEGRRGVSRRLPCLCKCLGRLPVLGGKVHLDPLQLGHSGPESFGASCRLPELVHLQDLSLERRNLLFEPLGFCSLGPKPFRLGSSGPKSVDFHLQLVGSRGSRGSSPEPL
ncbi:hypothetical protein GUJ93_ZPchr0001g31422 [Zizania palustris]|uniref:Uncharacterized protein n=1 Tax=Zizania palustris TaxID=103762 RepID=A0A8J5RMX4_ZIZPA|nr:hypothetical protein GUJ93_ZPchr0001g31422 [Zizania palustris]